MNELIEKMFVKTFVCKRLQDRIFFELSNNKSRNKAISRFAHINDELIELKYVMFQSNKLTSSEIETKLMSHCDKSKKVYIISTNEFDGEFVILATNKRLGKHSQVICTRREGTLCRGGRGGPKFA